MSKVISLEELKKRTGVTDEQLDHECDDEEKLIKIAEYMIDYQRFAPRLHVPGNIVKTFEQEQRLLSRSDLIAFEVFKEWHRNDPSIATYRVLVEVARELGDGTGAENICKICARGFQEGINQADINLRVDLQSETPSFTLQQLKGEADDVNKLESNKDVYSAKWQRAKGFTEADSILLVENVREDLEDQGITDNLRAHHGLFCSRKFLLLCIVVLIVLVLLVSTGAISFPLLQRKQGARPLDKAAAPPHIHTSTHAPPTLSSQAPPTHSTQAPPPPKHAPHTGPLTGTIIGKNYPPTMPQLCKLTLRTGKIIDIVTEIGMKYKIFGQLLLESHNEVQIHEASCLYQPKCIVDGVLGDWLVGKGRLPVTWERLVSTLDEAGLGVLAHDIRGQYMIMNKEEL